MNEDNQQRSEAVHYRMKNAQQTYFTWDFSGEVAVGGEFETAGVLGSVVYNVNVPRLPKATDRKTDVT